MSNPEMTLSDYERGYHDGVAVAAEDIKKLRAEIERLAVIAEGRASLALLIKQDGIWKANDG